MNCMLFKKSKWRQIHRVGQFKRYRCMNCGKETVITVPIREYIKGDHHDCNFEIVRKVMGG